MHYLDLTLPTPAENLACDEALLDACEAGGPEVLRVWEPAAPFVVVGYANRLATEVNLAACAELSVPMLRRVSGGGTVVQAPGCLNYALVLRLDRDPKLATIPGTNRFIMERQAAAVRAAWRGEWRVANGLVECCGDTDLAVSALKFSGNAQRRRQTALLFHGTFLLSADLALIERLLPLPSRQPGYRAGRSHRDFLTNLGVPTPSLKNALRSAWSARDALVEWPRAEVERLAQEKYATDPWNRKF